MPSTAWRAPNPASPLVRRLALLLAFALAGGATFTLAGGLSQTLPLTQGLISGLILIAAAAALFAWAAPPPPLHQSGPVAAPAGWFGARRRVFGAAVVVYLLSLVLWLAAGENTLIRLLWVAGMALFIVAHVHTWRWPAWGRAEGWDLLVVAGITAAGFILRFWRLTDLPAFLHGDIASQGLQALEIIRNPAPQWFGVGWSNIPLLDFVMMAWSMRLFGQDLFGLSMTAVLQGTLTLPAIYLLGRELFGRRAGAIAAALLAISYTHIHFSRIITTASPLLIICLTFFALFRALRLRSGLWFGVAGICLGLGLLVYYPIRVSVIIVILLVAWLLIWKRAAVLSELGGWFSFGMGSLLGFGPMMAFVLTHFSDFVGRGNEVTLANPTVMQHLLGKYAAATTGQVWVEQFRRTFLTFFLYGDSSTHFGFPGPMVGALTAVFLILGLGYTLRWLRDGRFFTLLVWFLSTLLLGGVITNDPPFWPHIVIVLPAVALMAAAAAERGWRGLVGASGQGSERRSDLALGALLAAAIVVSGWNGWQAYVKSVGDNADARVRAARYIASLPVDQRPVVVRDPIAWAERELMFLGQGRDGIDVTAAEVEAGGLAAPDRPTVFILTSNYADLLPSLQAQYPDGETIQHQAAETWSTFTTFTVVPPGYTPPAGLPDPVRSLTARTRLVWLLALATLGLATALGLFLRRRQPPPPLIAPAPGADTGLIHRPAALVPAARPPAIPAPAPAPAPPPAAPRETPLSGRRLALALGGMAAALLLAYFAQLFYDATFEGPLFIFLLERLPWLTTNRGQLMAGTIGYVLAMILFAVTAPALPRLVASALPRLTAAGRGSPAPAPHRSYPGELPPDARIIRPHAAPARPVETKQSDSQPAAAITVRWRLLLLAVAALPFAYALVRFARQGEDATVRWSWLAGLGLFLVGQVLWPAVRRAGDSRAEHSTAFHWPQVAILTVILLAAFWLRFNRLETIPDDLHGDMASMGLQARDWLASSSRSLFHEGWANIPILGFLPAAFGLRVFGDNLFGLNMSAVVAGMLSLLGLYLLTWRLFDSHRLAALAVAILAVNIPHIHFSRLAAYMDPWPFALFGAFFLADGLRARRPQSLALAGLLLGFGLQMYYSGRVIIVILAFAFLYLLLVRRQWLRDNWLGLGLALAAIVLTLGPNLIYYYRFPEPFLERSRAVWLFFEPVMTHLKGKYGLETPMQVLWQQTKLSLLMFNRAIDSSTQFGFPHPMFSSLLSPLVVLGAAYSLRRWRHPGLGLNFVWLLVMVVNGSILTGDAPFWPRLVGVLPAAALVAALPLDRLWTALSQLAAPRRRRAADLVLAAAAAALLIFAGRLNWGQYYEAVKNNARSQAFVGRFLYTLPTHISACMFSDPMALQVRETYFLAWPRQTVDLPADAPNGLIERCPGPPFVWILTPNHLDRLPLLQQRWPSGRIEDHFYGTGAPAFTSYTVLEGIPNSEALPLATPAPGEPPQVPPDQPQPNAPSAPTFPAYTAAGTAFSPEQTFLGNTDSSLWEISLGQKEVRDGDFRLQVGPAPGHDAAFDYVELRASDGSRYRFEAEDANTTSGDSYAGHEGIDGHWWLQAYGPFSGGQGLIAHKNESVPVLITAAAAPDGIYEVVIGSFGGDPANGVFALGVIWEP